MKTLLLDQGLPISTVNCLRAIGLETVHVGELGMASALDVEILDYAAEQDNIIVTLDADFHTLLALRQSQAPTVIRVRIEGLKGTDLAQLLMEVINQAKEEILSGSALSVTEKGIRVRRLPFH